MLEMFDFENEDEFLAKSHELGKLTQNFGHLAYSCVQAFDQKFNPNKIDNVDSIVDAMLEFYISWMRKGVQLGASFLNKNYDTRMSEKEYIGFSTLYDHPFFSFGNTFMSSFLEPYVQLVEEYGDSEDNKLLYDTGKRWVGGGIGMAGAVAGMVQAELLNAGASILRDSVNSLFAKGNHAVMKKEVQKLLSSDEVQRSLRDSLYESVCATAIGILEYLNLRHIITFSVDDLQIATEAYDDAVRALYDSQDLAKEIESESALYQNYCGTLSVMLMIVPFSVRMMDDVLILNIPDFPAADVYEILKVTGREQFFHDRWLDFVSDQVHNVQRRPIKTAQDIANSIQDIKTVLEGTPFQADDILSDLNDRYHSRYIWELYCDAKQDPFSKRARNFWMNPDPIAEYLTIYFFTEERFSKAEELVSLMLSKSVPVAYAIAAEWEIKERCSCYSKAKEFLNQGVKLNSPGCIFRMATVLLNGYWNTYKDISKGRAFLDKAVRMEYPDAINYLSISLKRGTFGYESNAAKSTWCQQKLRNWGLPKEYFTKHPDSYQDSLLWKLL